MECKAKKQQKKLKKVRRLSEMKKTTKSKVRTKKDEKRMTKLVRTGLKCGHDQDRECWDGDTPPGFNGQVPWPGKV
jgi:hypothetical protein